MTTKNPRDYELGERKFKRRDIKSFLDGMLSSVDRLTDEQVETNFIFYREAIEILESYLGIREDAIVTLQASMNFRDAVERMDTFTRKSHLETYKTIYETLVKERARRAI